MSEFEANSNRGELAGYDVDLALPPSKIAIDDAARAVRQEYHDLSLIHI